MGSRSREPTPGRRKTGESLGWQFSLPAIWAREATAQLIGPLVAWVIGGPVVVGREHLATVQAPFLVCPNHSSHFDSSTLRLALGRRHRRRLALAAAADYFWQRRPVAFAAGWLGSFPFSRTGRGHESMSRVEDLLSHGWSVLLYPEGSRSRTGEIGPFRAGVGLLATRTAVPVLPVRILGLHEVLPPGARWPRRSRVEVRFGPPLRALPGEDPRAFVGRLEACVRSL